MPIPASDFLDLAALSRFSHHLNTVASNDAIAQFRGLDLDTQCTLAARWAAGRDHSLDARAAQRADEWCAS